MKKSGGEGYPCLEWQKSPLPHCYDTPIMRNRFTSISNDSREKWNNICFCSGQFILFQVTDPIIIYQKFKIKKIKCMVGSRLGVQLFLRHFSILRSRRSTLAYSNKTRRDGSIRSQSLVYARCSLHACGWHARVYARHVSTGRRGASIG